MRIGKPGRRSTSSFFAMLGLLFVMLLAACDNGGTPTPVEYFDPGDPTATLAPAAIVTAIATQPPTATPKAAAGGDLTPTAQAQFDVFPGAIATAPADKAIAPLWARDAVLYQIFVRNFTPEGTLAAAQKRLPDLKDMGINLIYLMPIQTIGVENRKGSLGSPYSISDYRAIDPSAGTEADLRAFVETAHGLGMHVIMDLVANHTSWDSVLAKQHPDWFKHDDKGNFVPPMPDWTDVIQIDHSNPEVLQYFVTMTTHFMQADLIDGFRCDYSTGVPIEFWQAWRTAVKKINPDVFLLSENDDARLTTAFDATYDQHLYQDILIAKNSNTPHRVMVDPSTNYATSGPYLLQTRFFENHDHDRVAAAFQNLPIEALETASTYLLTSDGIPFIENGQEVGITHTISLFEPDPIQWNLGNQQLRDHFKKILTIRNSNPALQHGDFVDVGTLVPGVAAFVRRTADQQVLVVISFAKANVNAPLPASLAKHTGQDLADGSAVDLSKGLDMTPWSWRIIELK